MDIKKLAPWNWFTKEEAGGAAVPVHKHEMGPDLPKENVYPPFFQLQRQMDRWFENAFRDHGPSPFATNHRFSPFGESGFLKPHVDIGANDKEYTITVEIPGVEEQDVKIDLTDNIMTIRGEKQLQKEEKEKDYYRIERSYGSFQRVLTLPEDADQNEISATFRKGVLRVSVPRRALPHADVKRIEIKGGE